MSDAVEDEQSSRKADLAADLVSALASAVAWSLIDVWRLGGGVPPLKASFSLLGCTALTLGTLVTILRRVRPLGDGLRAVAFGAVLSAGPLAIVGAALKSVTHHRALGGVTFALLALAGILLLAAVAGRLIRLSHHGGRGAKVARATLLAASAASLAWIAASLLPALFRHPGSAVETALADGSIGGALLSVALLLPRYRPPGWIVGATFAAWVGGSLAGTAVASRSAELRSALGGRTPVALGLAGLLGE